MGVSTRLLWAGPIYFEAVAAFTLPTTIRSIARQPEMVKRPKDDSRLQVNKSWQGPCPPTDLSLRFFRLLSGSQHEPNNQRPYPPL